MAPPLTVGLTGGLASGKSTVAVLLARRGAAVLDADAVVHELYGPGREGAAAVVELLGFEMLAADGSVDRNRLADRVLGDEQALQRLNAAIHPLVRARVAAWLKLLAEETSGPSVAVVEAALLVETGSWRDYDLLAVVWCRPEQQLERALERGLSSERARELLASQLPMAEKLALADVGVDNTGGRAELVAEVEGAWKVILDRCEEKTPQAGP